MNDVTKMGEGISEVVTQIHRTLGSCIVRCSTTNKFAGAGFGFGLTIVSSIHRVLLYSK